jgi:hypothetical protein
MNLAKQIINDGFDKSFGESSQAELVEVAKMLLENLTDEYIVEMAESLDLQTLSDISFRLSDTSEIRRLEDDDAESEDTDG